MVQAKCINKIRNDNNLITHYELMDNSGDRRTVTAQQLKDAIKLNKIEIINLKLSKDGKLIDKNIEDKIDSYANMNYIQESNEKVHAKALMLGMAPTLDSNDTVIGLAPGDRTVFSDASCVINNWKLIGKEAMFTGCKPLTSKSRYSEMIFDSIIVTNPCIVSNINMDGGEGVHLIAKEITLSHELIDIKTVDEIFKILKKQCLNYNSLHTIKIDESISKKIGYDELYNRAEKIIKRQKPSANDTRRIYDISIYFLFLHSMYISTGCIDNRYKALANLFIEEYRTKLRRLRNDSKHYSYYAALHGMSTGALRNILSVLITDDNII